MSAPDLEVFAICAADAVERGGAKAFNLLRYDEAGEARPFPIVIVRTRDDAWLGYVNACPHEGLWLNIGDGEFFTPDRTLMKCGRHGATFAIDSGLCVAGPCVGESLRPLAVVVMDGELCLCGERIAEETEPRDPFDEGDDETMEIMIHPD
jgi:nitrite reductase/ring-hydroxylating ferredoxin subunit